MLLNFLKDAWLLNHLGERCVGPQLGRTTLVLCFRIIPQNTCVNIFPILKKTRMAPHATDSIPSSNGFGVHADRDGNAIAGSGIASTLKRYPDTDISVLIVGGGIGGLMTALECWRKGLTVKILERSTGPVYTGEQRQ